MDDALQPDNRMDDLPESGNSLAQDAAQDHLTEETSDLYHLATTGERRFEDLTVSELIGQFFSAPRSTAQTLLEFASAPVNAPALPTAPTPRAEVVRRPRSALSAEQKRVRGVFSLYIAAFSLAFWGCVILVSAETRYESSQLRAGTPFLLAAFLVWMGAEVYRYWPELRKSLRQTSLGQPASLAAEQGSFRDLFHPVRLVALLGVVLFGFLAWTDTGGNEFRPAGFWAWVVSIIMVIIATAPVSWASPDTWRRIATALQRLRPNWVWLALAVIVLFGAYFRLSDLSGVPPEMTSDHIEKLLDSNRVLLGDRDVFFRNNGGREPFQMYAMALVSQLPGLGINFQTLKLLAVFEGLVTLPVLFLMGREVIGDRNRTLGIVVGLLLAALVAASYWHVTVTRLALRIVMTPLVMSLLMIFLVRGMRTNRRGDFVLAGLVLGFGLYTYQAVRMMPLVVLAGVALAILAHIRRPRQVGRYVQHLAVLVLVAFVVFIPLFRFSVDDPDAFWMRAAGRLLGDDIIQTTDQFGNIVERAATFEERMSAFQDNLGVLADNMRNALLMFNWKGDVAWISGVPNYPAMDSFTGALFIVGLAAWLVLSIRSGDPVYWLIPLALLLMLLPSALSIAAPLENPSATRSSGAIPMAYLIAALPLALIAFTVRDVLDRQTSLFAAVSLIVIVIFGAYSVNARTYFEDYRESYLESWRSHSYPGQVLRGFAESDGSYGNAFIMAYPHWLDHRILGLEGGIIDWPNAVADANGRTALERTPDFLYDAWLCPDNTYRLDPDKDVLFFLHVDDTAAQTQFAAWFPQGRSTVFEAERRKDEFVTYRVPALGTAALQSWLRDHIEAPRCLVN
ncbi:MAG: hypothetical protein OHK0046_25900 [Anaerolineae bacterium]